MWAPMGASMRSASEFLEELALDLAPNKGDRPSQPIMVPLAPAALRKMVHFGRLLQNQKDDAGGLMRSAIGKAPGPHAEVVPCAGLSLVVCQGRLRCTARGNRRGGISRCRPASCRVHSADGRTSFR